MLKVEFNLKDIVIVGAGGCAREVAWLLEENNREKKEWNILGYVAYQDTTYERDYPVLGDDEWLQNQTRDMAVVIAVGNGELRRQIFEKICHMKNLSFPTIISNKALVSNYVQIGQGTIICAGVTVTVDIKIGDFCYFNLNSTISHDCVIEDYVTVYSDVSISGNVTVKKFATLGAGTKVKQGLSIGENSVTGIGSVVVKNVTDDVTVVGCPARVLREDNL